MTNFLIKENNFIEEKVHNLHFLFYQFAILEQIIAILRQDSRKNS